MEEALLQHIRCLEMSDQGKTAYQKQLFISIAEFVLHVEERESYAKAVEALLPGGRPGRYEDAKSVTMATLQSIQEHPCWPELLDSALAALSKFGLIDVKIEMSPKS